ncbi:MAG: hypothetical protein WC579_02425 [Candidatus Paceibacterota bacterium]|nr:hypothetical protein [Candidatus Paceibacterota bacterium]
MKKLNIVAMARWIAAIYFMLVGVFCMGVAIFFARPGEIEEAVIVGVLGLSSAWLGWNIWRLIKK